MLQSPQPNTFAYSPTGEPHYLRRRAILSKYPGIRRLYGHDTRTAWVTLGVVVAQLGIATFLELAAQRGSIFGSGWAVALAVVGVGAILSHWAGQAIHECSHNLALKGVAANRWLAMFANVCMAFPVAMSFIRYHVDHHRLLGVDGGDADLPTRLEARVIGNSTWRKAVWLFFYFFFYTSRSVTFVKRPNRWEVTNFVLQMTVNAIIVWTLGWTAMAYLIASTIIGHSLHPVAAHFIHEHYIFNGPQETYSYYGPLNKVTFNVGYHVEHHDFMNVSGWRLPELHATAPEYYRDLTSHRSWTWVLWHFATARTMSVASRIVRLMSDYERARSNPAREAVPTWAPSRH